MVNFNQCFIFGWQQPSNVFASDLRQKQPLKKLLRFNSKECDFCASKLYSRYQFSRNARGATMFGDRLHLKKSKTNAKKLRLLLIRPSAFLGVNDE